MEIVTAKNVQRMRTKLSNSTVPLDVGGAGANFYDEFAKTTNIEIPSNDYMPQIILGYLGYPKK